MFDLLNKVNIELISSVITAIATVLCAFFLFVQARRQMYLDVIVKQRQQSIDERRQVLKKLYYYTDPELFTSKVIGTDEHVKKLIEIRACLQYRLLETLYPESEIIQRADDLIQKTIKCLKNGSKQPSLEERNKCLYRIKVYNFASWFFVQSQSGGRSRNSVSSFNKFYRKCVKQLLKASKDAEDKGHAGSRNRYFMKHRFMPINQLDDELLSHFKSDKKTTDDSTANQEKQKACEHHGEICS